MVVRIPCLAYVIQLSLRELLGSVKADPQNDTTDRNVSDVQAQAQARSLRASQSEQVIVQTLVKVSVSLCLSLNISNNYLDSRACCVH